MDHPHVQIPELEVTECEPNKFGESNTVYRIRGLYQGMPLTAFVKRSKNPSRSLANEYAILNSLASSVVPAPRVLWASEERDVLLLEAIDGVMILDLIDPRREQYDESSVLMNLHRYGAMLGRIHRLTPECSHHQRAGLYWFIGEEQVSDQRFRRIVGWLENHKMEQQSNAFVHGDYNLANVLFRDGIVSGIIDWEFAGSGWKEYELAWALRARLSFFNRQPERDAFLHGYCEYSSFDAHALRWCEILNYLHDAYWSLEVDSAYVDLSTAQALKLIG